MRTKCIAVLFAGLVAAWSHAWLGPGLRAKDVKLTTDIAVLVNSQNPVNNVSLAALRKPLLGEQRAWSNKVSVALILRESGSREREVPLRVAAQMTEAQFKEYWLVRIFRGEASAEPLSVPSNGLASEYVSTNTGGLTFAQGTNVRRDLKVLKVDGQSPGDADYPLK